MSSINGLQTFETIKDDFVLSNPLGTPFLLSFKLFLDFLVRKLLYLLLYTFLVLIYKVYLPGLRSFLEVVRHFIAPYIKVFALGLPAK